MRRRRHADRHRQHDLQQARRGAAAGSARSTVLAEQRAVAHRRQPVAAPHAAFPLADHRGRQAEAGAAERRHGQQLAHVADQRHPVVAVQHPEGDQEDRREHVAVDQRHPVAEVQLQADAKLVDERRHHDVNGSPSFSALPVSSRNTSSRLAFCTCSSRMLDPLCARRSGGQLGERGGHVGGAEPRGRCLRGFDLELGHARHPGEDGRLERLGRGERDRRRRARRGDQLRGPAGRDDPALVDDREAIAEQLGFLDVVRRQQHRVAVALHPPDLAVQLAPRLRVEAGRGFVEEDQLGIVDEREREREPLTLPARERVERRVAPSRRARSARAARRGVARCW